ncbi:MAG: hypothetical protein IJN65_01115 [Clostridia bacterium]|nr:hypothetical protein [Clostridia bacterium]
MIDNKVFKTIFISLLVIVSLANCIGYVFDSFFYGMDDLPTGEYLFSSTSPDGSYTLKTYKVENCLGTAIRGELTANSKTGQPKNIYWSTDFSSAYVVWNNASLITINGVMLDLSEDHIYDSRDESDVEYSLVKTKEQ